MNAETVKRKTLGRGLNALFGEQDDASDAPAAAGAAPAAAKTSDTLPVDMMAPSPLQPRMHFSEDALNELAASVREKGILQPILVRPDPSTSDRYEIIAGERRWRAAQRAQLHNVPVIIREFNDEQVLEVALIENLQRQDLSAVEEGRGYQRLIDQFNHTQEDVADIVGKSRAHVANTLRLLSLPESVQKLVDERKLSPGQARPLIGLVNAEPLAMTILRKGMSARQAERLARGHGTTKRKALRNDKDADTRALEQTLEDATGYNVDISFNGKSGKVVIGYSSLEQLDDIVRRLSSGGKRGKADNRDTGTVDLEEILARDEFAEDKSDIMSGFGLGDVKHDLKQDHSLDPASPNVHEDPAADDIGAGGATHR
ncbi:MAG: ParB/RepB/Spo0J family partition protein [Rhodospirillaceae bacterium]|nr:ParB/RepB/Spo0J family partition protein [Rhodospirillaceae bacterium]